MSLLEMYSKNSVIQQLGISNEDIAKCLSMWQQPHRHYHGLQHLVRLLDAIDSASCDEQVRDKLKVIALFHDVVYNPLEQNNEEQSIAVFKGMLKCVEPDLIASIVEAIADTKHHHLAKSILSFYFCSLDLIDLTEADYGVLAKNEKELLKEYQCYDFPFYRENRIKFAEGLIKSFEGTKFYNGGIKKSTEFIISYLRSYRPQIGLYPGSFNPFHVGHLNILEKAEPLFDKVIIGLGVNPEKTASGDERALQKILPFHQIRQFSTMLPDLIAELSQYADVTLIRGLRNGYDLNYEMNQLRFLQEDSPAIRVIYIPCDKEFEHISSSAIRGIQKFDRQRGEKYFPQKYNYFLQNKTQE